MTTQPPRPIRVMVIDDHPVVRRGIVSVLVDEPDIEVIAQGQNGPEAIELYRKHRPDVTLMDLMLPGMSGVDTIREIRRDSPGARIVVLTTFAGDEDIYRALEVGAKGYLLKDTGVEKILETIHAVHAGRRWIPNEIAQKLAERVPHTELSRREVEVLTLVAHGESNKIIADQLGITEATVKSHVSNILVKLGASDRTGAVTAALQRGIIKL